MIGKQTKLVRKIFFLNLLTILGYFIAVSVITIIHYNDEYDTYLRQRAERKTRSITAALRIIVEGEVQSSKYKSLRELLQSSHANIHSQADINNVDINIYSFEGELINSTLYASPAQLDTAILVALSQESYILKSKEINDNLSQIATYKKLAFGGASGSFVINTNYMQDNHFHNIQKQELLIQISIIYSLLLFVTLGVNYIFSSSITTPLTRIVNSLKRMELTKTNEPLVWKNKDEVGALVDAYNQMLVEIDKATKALTQSERDKAWRKMAKQIAHEIKNPLTPMRLYVQSFQNRLLNADQLSDQQRESVSSFAETMLSQIDTLTNVADSFKDFSSFEVKDRVPIDLHKEVLKITNIFARNKVEIISPSDKVIVCINAAHLSQVVTNVIKNAFQAIPEERTPDVIIQIETKDQEAILSVKDNGTGIDEETRAMIFEPNFTTKNSGMGMGMAITKTIVEAYQGRISFESLVDVGTTFYLHFPLDKTNASSNS